MTSNKALEPGASEQATFFLVFETTTAEDETVLWHKVPSQAWLKFEVAVAEARRLAQHYLANDFCDDECRGVRLEEQLDGEKQSFSVSFESSYRGLPTFRVKRVTVDRPR